MSPPSVPKDAEAMIELLKEAGVDDYEPRVINFLIELAYRSSFTVLEDAHVLADYSNKEAATVDDVLLAIRLSQEKCPDLRTVLQGYAEETNRADLPAFKEDFDAGSSLASLENTVAESYKLRPDFRQLLEEEHPQSSASDGFGAVERVESPTVAEKRRKLDS
uniref:Transcription initiation factor TFIID subunit 9 n=1 Tax=Trichuris muris TaxID=70415 RepID=A0A5S6QIA9_TRIMR